LFKEVREVAKRLFIPFHYYFHGGPITKGVEYLIQTADLAATNSKAYQKIFTELGIPNVDVVLPVTDVTNFLKEPSSQELDAIRRLIEQYGLEGQKIILHPSRISPRKGQEHTIRAAAELFKKEPELRSKVTFVLLGPERNKDGERTRLKVLARQLGVDVVFVEAQPHQELEKWYRAAYLVLYPTVAAEPFGLVPVEAQAAGTPVLVYDTGGLPETLKNNETGFVIPAGNYQELAMRIRELVLDETRRNQFGRSAREYIATHFSLKNTAKIYAETAVRTVERFRDKVDDALPPKDSSLVLSNVYNEMKVPLNSDKNLFEIQNDSLLVQRWKAQWLKLLNESMDLSQQNENPPMFYNPILIPSKTIGPFKRLILPKLSLSKRHSISREDEASYNDKPIDDMVASVTWLFDDPFDDDFIVRTNAFPKAEYHSLIVSKSWMAQRLTSKAVGLEFKWAREGVISEFHRAEKFVPHLHVHLYASDLVPIFSFSDTWESLEAPMADVSIGKTQYPVPHIALRSKNESALKHATVLMADLLEREGIWFVQSVMPSGVSDEITASFFLIKKIEQPFGFGAVGFLKVENSKLLNFH